MAERKVYQSCKDKDGDITALYNPSATSSPRAKAFLVEEITGVMDGRLEDCLDRRIGEADVFGWEIDVRRCRIV